MPEGHDAEAFAGLARKSATQSSAAAWGSARAPFRIGHMGDLNEAMLLGALGVIEMQLARDVPQTLAVSPPRSTI